MAKANPHSKIIAASAAEILKPLGIFQKGRSRLWIDDHGWWLGLVEFQPSSWSKGSYLNVGMMWLWHEKDYFSFDLFERLSTFVSYKSNDQFAKESARLTGLAAEKICEYREMFPDVDAAAGYLTDRVRAQNFWDLFYASVACGYSGNITAAHNYFDKLKQDAAERDWERSLQARGAELDSIVDDCDKFRKQINQTILATRRLLKLSDSGNYSPQLRPSDAT